MVTADSSISRFFGALKLDRSLIENVEKNPQALWLAAGIVALAGAGRGMSIGFEAGWRPLLFHGVAGLVIWIACAGLIWNVAHRILGYSESFGELTRILALPAVPLLGLWLNAIPLVGGLPWFGIGLHVLALAALLFVTRTALAISFPRALGICALSLATAVLLFSLLGLFLVGRPAGEDSVSRVIPFSAAASSTA